MGAKAIQRDLQVGYPVCLRFRKLSGADIDLDRGQNERGHVELSVAAFSDGCKLWLCRAFAQLNVGPLLLGDGGDKTQLAAAGLVVMAHEKPGAFRQCINALDGVKELFRGAAGKVAARRAVVRHE